MHHRSEMHALADYRAYESLDNPSTELSRSCSDFSEHDAAEAIEWWLSSACALSFKWLIFVTTQRAIER
jgi:hypothetical protein